jgi:hypothetical protein
VGKEAAAKKDFGTSCWQLLNHDRVRHFLRVRKRASTVRLYLLGLGPLFAGLWSGLKLYGKLDDAAFRKVILLLLLASGLVLIVPRLPF